jgi:hypothetical protein
MTEEMISLILEEVRRVCAQPGFGEVTVVIAKGRPRWLRVSRETWLEERTQGPPGRQTVLKLTE